MEFSRLGIVSDHAGFLLKNEIVAYIKKLTAAINIDDFGVKKEAPKVDYPDYACTVAKKVSQKKLDGAIAICGTGIGMCIVANKFPLIQAVCPWDEYSCRMAREHNNANILCLGSRALDLEKAQKLVRIWLETPFEKQRHQQRLEKIRLLEKENSLM